MSYLATQLFRHPRIRNAIISQATIPIPPSFLPPGTAVPDAGAPIPPLSPVPAVPNAGAPELAEARKRQRKIAASRRGYLANWLTGPTGLRAPATVAQKMLLGQ